MPETNSPLSQTWKTSKCHLKNKLPRDGHQKNSCLDIKYKCLIESNSIMILINYVTNLYATANKYSSKDKTAVPLKNCHYYHRTAPPPSKMDTSPQRALSSVLNEAIVERFYCDLILLTDPDSYLLGN